ncbi:Asp-tRNA(Asn)/Glu-tRNA(Gln) amidotransferase subunit GatC [Candidatus Kaiserbacteria bacterium]|nr:Asp-tRNA(Asn)/Glu-tRNA(Gln) amidotransferase subunit GatC [Candidatus Kaiserbacteria bacterium]MCB9811344.1 Asp-tRNA(Asn)/Glu-tRNA(Gln) amidotransferase subunit GatC [Candidatus Nomurabacteria bacterium]
MTKEEILHLGTLSRIRLSEAEAEKLHTEIDSILAYVSQVNDIAASGDLTKKTGAVHNVFRVDEVAATTNATADELIAAFPEKKGRFLRVKKILDND